MKKKSKEGYKINTDTAVLYAQKTFFNTNKIPRWKRLLELLFPIILHFISVHLNLFFYIKGVNTFGGHTVPQEFHLMTTNGNKVELEKVIGITITCLI